jgi:hypothetical protein
MSQREAERRQRQLARDLLLNHLNEDEAAAALKHRKRTLRKWRQQGTGPAYRRIGRTIYYTETAIAAWLQTLEVEPVRAA